MWTGSGPIPFACTVDPHQRWSKRRMPDTAIGFFRRRASTVVPRPPCTIKRSMYWKRTPKSARSTSMYLPLDFNSVTRISSSFGTESLCFFPTKIMLKSNLHSSTMLEQHARTVAKGAGILLNVIKPSFCLLDFALSMNSPNGLPNRADGVGLLFKNSNEPARGLSCLRKIKFVIWMLNRSFQSLGSLNVPGRIGITKGILK
mmetsp:Transcript_65088/g.103121  ORF Transcript_65088/g.103121 Transcript_65088/m.103121 type:complete len:202 (-) Transcript_65088:4-609(-)